MSAEAYPQVTSETDVLFEMNPGTIIAMLPHLQLDKKQYDIVNSFFLFRDATSIAAIANMITVPYDQFISTLDDVAATVKEKVESDKIASRTSRITKPTQGKAAREKRQPSGDDSYLLEVETIRETNTVPQAPSLDTPINGNCKGISDGELEEFFAKRLSVQKKIIKTYCLNCALMEACGEYAVEQGHDDMVYGGYTKKALSILIKRRDIA